MKAEQTLLYILSIEGGLIIILLGIVGFWLSRYVKSTDELNKVVVSLRILVQSINTDQNSFIPHFLKLKGVNPHWLIDPKVMGIDALEVQLDIRKNWQYYQEAGLTTMEDSTPTWTHMDCRNTGSDSLFIIQPHPGISMRNSSVAKKWQKVLECQLTEIKKYLS